MITFLRKTFLVLALLGLWISSARAETVGVIITANVPYFQDMHDALAARLSREGYGDRVKFLIQRPFPDPVSWKNAARKLVAADVDIIVTYGSSATLAAVKEGAGKPVIFAGVYEPMVPGRKNKCTGMYYKAPISSVLRYLKATTTIKTMGVLYSSFEDESVRQFSEISSLSAKFGFRVQGFDMRKTADTAAILSQNDADALFLTTSSLINTAFPAIIAMARNLKLPTGSLVTHGDAIPLIALVADAKEQGQGAADKLIAIINGKPCESIPTSAGKDIELIFNMNEARELGIRIPVDLVTEATRLIH